MTELTGDYKTDFELVCETKDLDLLSKMVRRVTLGKFGPLITYEEEDRLVSIFGPSWLNKCRAIIHENIKKRTL